MTSVLEKYIMESGEMAMKRKSHVVRLGVLALALTLVTTSLLGGTMARYVTEVTGTATATVAAWSFKANEQTATMSNIDLASTAYDATTIADGKIAPGTSGSFKIALDGSGSGVGIEYAIKIAAAGGTTLPDDLTFKVDNIAYTLGDEIEGNIDYNASASSMKKDVTLQWEWPFDENDDKDTNDNTFSGKTWTLDITVTGKQVAPTAPTTP